MTVANPPFVLQNRTDHPAEAFRRALAGGMTQPGVSARDDYKVEQNGTPNMSVNVAAGDGFVACYNALDGYYHAFNDGTVNVVVTAAHATLARYDLVCLRVQDQEQSGVANTADLIVVAGTPNASPVDPTPAAGASYLVLARVVVGAAVTTIVTGNITDRRTQAAAAGGTQIVTSATRPATPHPGMVIYETDTKNVRVWDGAAWTITAAVGAWTAYTPAWTTSGTPPAIGNGTITGKYTVVGKTCTVQILLTAGTTTTYGTTAWNLSLPIAVVGGSCIGHTNYRDSSASFHFSGAAYASGSTIALRDGNGAGFWQNGAPVAGATGDTIQVTVIYEIA